ncbi:hypothetical protein Q3G72_001174 [Acer saccharum]|nr:hypothetical protein Q3G72_001174 [Acer saccharum]
MEDNGSRLAGKKVCSCYRCKQRNGVRDMSSVILTARDEKGTEAGPKIIWELLIVHVKSLNLHERSSGSPRGFRIREPLIEVSYSIFL